MTSNEDLLRLLQEYNRVHVELVRCIRMRLTTQSEGPSNTMGSLEWVCTRRFPNTAESIG